MKKVDLNVDIGEGFPYDRELLKFATSANICGGEHAGRWELTMATAELCLQLKKRIGMHPGYPDRTGMGRRSPLANRAEEWTSSLIDQALRFRTAIPCEYIKPHGAFYNDNARPLDGNAKSSLVGGLPGMHALLTILAAGLPLMGMPGTTHELAAREAKVGFIREGFADRAYTEFGTLKPRTELGAMLEDPDLIKAQVLRLAGQVDSICLHGDTSNCLEFAELVTKTLVDAGFEVGY